MLLVYIESFPTQMDAFLQTKSYIEKKYPSDEWNPAVIQIKSTDEETSIIRKGTLTKKEEIEPPPWWEKFENS